jgi:putative FmdB family regulatory protein
MPIYEYRCQSCGEELEKLQRMSDDRLVDCPACGESSLKRLVSAAAFRLKGSGWYETDFKKGDKRNLHDSGPGAANNESAGKDAASGKSVGSNGKKTEKSSSAGSDKKPAAKSTAQAGKSNTA